MLEFLLSFFVTSSLIVVVCKAFVSQTQKMQDLIINDANYQVKENQEENTQKKAVLQQKFSNFKESIEENIQITRDSVELLEEKLTNRKTKVIKATEELENVQKEHQEILNKKKSLLSNVNSLLEEKVSKKQEVVKEEILKNYELQTKASCQTELTYYVERTKKFQERVSNNILKSTIQRVTAESSVDKSSRILKMPSKNSFQRILKDPSILEVICQTLGVEIEPIEREY